MGGPARLGRPGFWAGLACALTTACAQPAGPSIEARARALDRAHGAVVGLRATAVDDARSSRLLGAVREGSGVVIDADGLVLTIGYLVLEAEQVDVLLDAGHSLPARVVAYDPATGFGLVQALAPLHRPAAPLGDPRHLRANEPLMVASGDGLDGGDGEVGVTYVVSQRSYSGSWEYFIDSALFTAPPLGHHSGAGLFDGDGRLLGIGSLRVDDALGPDHLPVAGNMFVAVDLLVPILAELRSQGVSRQSLRAWIGVHCSEDHGEVHVRNVSDDSPADIAGLLPGDRIVRVDGTGVSSLEGLWKALWRGGRPEREIAVEIERGTQTLTLSVQAVDRLKTLRHPEGI